MALLGQIKTRGEITDIRQVMDYVRQLENQIRYAISNLDGENISDGAIGAEKLSGTVQSTVKKADETAKETGETEKKVANLGTAVRELQGWRRGLETGGGVLKFLDGSLADRIYVGPTQPEGDGILWLKNDPEDAAAPLEAYLIPRAEEQEG